MINPSAEPQSPAGRYAAAGLQALPSVFAGGGLQANQIPRALMGAATSGVAGQAAADIAGPEWGAVGAMLPGARGRVSPASAGERATLARQGEAFGKARELGIPIPPRELKVDKAQQKIQDAVNKQLKLPEGTELSPETLDAYRKSHYDDYRAIIKEPALNGQITSSPTFKAEIRKIATEERELRQQFPNSVKDTGLQQVLTDFVKPNYPVEGAMSQVQRLRESARNNLGSASATDDTRRLGLVQRRIANAMENLIGENVANVGKRELTANWQVARKAMAQAHDVESSLDPVTRKISTAKLSALQTEGQPLSGQLKKLSDVGGAFPGATKAPDKYGDELFTKRGTPMAITHPEALGAHWMTRMWDPITTSGPAQKYMVDPRSRLTPEQEMRLRALLAGQRSNQGDIPAPP